MHVNRQIGEPPGNTLSQAQEERRPLHSRWWSLLNDPRRFAKEEASPIEAQERFTQLAN